MALLAPLLFVVAAAAEQPKSKPEPPKSRLSAGLGPCSAEFRVTQSSTDPVADAKISGAILVPASGTAKQGTRKLELRTDADGRALLEGLPETLAGPLEFAVDAGGLAASVSVDGKQCHGRYQVVLPDRPPREAR